MRSAESSGNVVSLPILLLRLMCELRRDVRLLVSKSYCCSCIHIARAQSDLFGLLSEYCDSNSIGLLRGIPDGDGREFHNVISTSFLYLTRGMEVRHNWAVCAVACASACVVLTTAHIDSAATTSWKCLIDSVAMHGLEDNCAFKEDVFGVVCAHWQDSEMACPSELSPLWCIDAYE